MHRTYVHVVGPTLGLVKDLVGLKLVHLWCDDLLCRGIGLDRQARHARVEGNDRCHRYKVNERPARDMYARTGCPR